MGGWVIAPFGLDRDAGLETYTHTPTNKHTHTHTHTQTQTQAPTHTFWRESLPP